MFGHELPSSLIPYVWFLRVSTHVCIAGRVGWGGVVLGSGSFLSFYCRWDIDCSSLRQTMVDSWYCLDRFVPEGTSQVWRRWEVGNTKRRSLNTRLSSGTSAGTFAVSAGPYIYHHAKAGTKNERWHVFGTISKKGTENRSSRFEPKNLWLSFSRGSGPPLTAETAFATPEIVTPASLGYPLSVFSKNSILKERHPPGFGRA